MLSEYKSCSRTHLKAPLQGLFRSGRLPGALARPPSGAPLIPSSSSSAPGSYEAGLLLLTILRAAGFPAEKLGEIERINRKPR
jgi:hypothetical protein